MRMVVTDFDEPVVLRFATLDLVRGDYRRYIQAGNTTNDPTSGLNISGDEVIVTSVSVEETPGYTIPPGVEREEFINNNTVVPELSLIHISEPTRPRLISYAVFCLKKKK